MVEIVAWVAGVDHKESKVVVTCELFCSWWRYELMNLVDDGNGETVLQVTVELRRRLNAPARKEVFGPVQPSEPAEDSSTRYFLPARERKAQRKAAAEAARQAVEEARKAKIMAATYEQLDIRVGDTVRIVGRIEQWSRRRPDGSVDGVRQVVVADGSGGSICELFDGQNRSWS